MMESGEGRLLCPLTLDYRSICPMRRMYVEDRGSKRLTEFPRQSPSDQSLCWEEHGRPLMLSCIH